MAGGVIPYQVALLGFVFFGAMLMSMRNGALAFSLVWTIGTFFLPSSRGLDFEGLPYIDKAVVTHLALFAGTSLFRQDVLDRFRPRASDLLLIAWTVFIMLTSIVNALGVYDGLSAAFDQVLGFLSLLFFARIYLNTPEALKTFMTTLIVACMVYLPLVLYEFRMSPQMSSIVYGYFPHVFAQHFRWGWWRPVVFYPHALRLGRMYALATFLALFPLRNELGRLIPYGRYAFLLPAIGLVCSLSFGPYLMFFLLCGLYVFARRATWMLYAMPLAASLWLLMVFAGRDTGDTLVDMVAIINQDRAASLDYRLTALEEYRYSIMEKPWFGHGGWGGGRIEGRATDSAVLIMALSRGVFGAGLYFGWHYLMMHFCVQAYKLTVGSRFGNLALTVAILLSIALSVSVIDTALDGHTSPLAVSVAAIGLMIKRGRLAPPFGAMAAPQRPARRGATSGDYTFPAMRMPDQE